MTLVDLDALVAWRDPHSYGMASISANPAAVMAFPSVDTTEDLIGMLAEALRGALERRAAVEAVAMARLPRRWV